MGKHFKLVNDFLQPIQLAASDTLALREKFYIMGEKCGNQIDTIDDLILELI